MHLYSVSSMCCRSPAPANITAAVSKIGTLSYFGVDSGPPNKSAAQGYAPYLEVQVLYHNRNMLLFRCTFGHLKTDLEVSVRTYAAKFSRGAQIQEWDDHSYL
jgi:hypothetical protein